MINWIKKILKINTIVIEFQPIKRKIDNNILFNNETIAREHFNLIYNEMVQSMLNFETEKTKALQDVLRDYKVLSDIHWSKINFNIVWPQIVSTNTVS